MSDTGTMTRALACDGIHNFRDYGGYPIAGGGRLRTGRLFRSAQHFGASPADLARVGKIGLGAVIDLRGNSERQAAPCPRPDDFTARIVSVADETVEAAPHVEAARSVMTPDDARNSMRNTYATMPFRPVLMALYARYFETLAECDAPTLIHCLAGKDRTGIAVALLHHLVGVHHDDFMADYLMTNVTGNIDARLKAGARHIRVRFGDLSDDTVRVLMSVEPEYLENAFAAMAERYGSVDAFLAEGMGVTPGRRAAIIDRLAV